MCCLGCCRAADLGTHDYCLDCDPNPCCTTGYSQDWPVASDSEETRKFIPRNDNKENKPAKDEARRSNEKDKSRPSVKDSTMGQGRVEDEKRAA
ncbi:hypothetical protein ACRE_058530 [Hapsidospora chrysogenum ATCC 11550]|uniref:Uncharacterized protein n=1 Tax=Hapsidospora chrysogenum (strain ATCC 11550 / CBS 779.69 / DSM 880 / IAM 14645 / JCM 23072 / IMI 49137) TaxID=857340 RepID=A0A086T226_HAPC1|nr:hypothetical protein ACRE_058530 [Hapsidospora chrysogenum ATCC 11550]